MKNKRELTVDSRTGNLTSPPSAVGSIIIFFLQCIVGVGVLLWAVFTDVWYAVMGSINSASKRKARREFEALMDEYNLQMIDERIAELRGGPKWEPNPPICSNEGDDYVL